MEQEERNLLGIANLGAIIPVFGLGLILLIFLSKKEKNKEFNFQILQAFIFQFLELLYTYFMLILYLVGLFGSLVFSAFLPKPTHEFIGSIFPLIVSMLFFSGLLFFISFSFYASLNLFLGRDFEYPIISLFLKKKIEEEKNQ